MPFTESDFEAVKALVKDGKIDQAKTKLRAASSPKADAILSKLLAKYPDAPAVAPVLTPISSSSHWLYIFAAVVGVVLIGVGVVSYINYREAQEKQSREWAIEFAVDSACWDTFHSRYFNTLGADIFPAMCDEEVRYMFSVYPDTIEHCYDDWPNERKKFTQCLSDGANWSGMSMLTAAEEKEQ